MNPILTCDRVQIAYEGRTVVKDVSFSLERGEYLCIVGENGSGKSTLLKGVLGLVPLKNGNITLEAKGIGYLPQQSATQRDFPASVQEVVLSGCLPSQKRGLFYSKESRLRADKTMQELHIDSIRKKSFRELSGGQQQRVLLARALCSAEDILLLDEPITGLDPLVTEEMYETIRELNRTRQLTVVMVSHDIAGAVRYADKILHMDREMEFFGSKAEYIETEIGRRFSKGI